jgi:hypothetical protein
MKRSWMRIVVGLVLAVGLATVVAPRVALAATCDHSNGTASWDTSSTWSCGHVPLNTDDVTISGGTVNLDTTSAVAQSVSVSGGILAMGSDSTTARSLTVGGNVSIAGGATLTVNSAAATHSLEIGGNFINDGTFTTVNSSGQINTSFGGTAATISGSNAIAFYNVTVNSGATVSLSRNIAVLTGGTATVNGTLNTGTYVVSGAGTFTLAAGGTLGIGSPSGITAAVGTATGNIQTTTARNFNVGGNYTYNGTAAQNTGTGFPTNLTGILTINSGNTVTLNSARVIASGGTLSIVAGVFAAGDNTITGPGFTIKRSGGTMTGQPGPAAAYDVIYTGNSMITTDELNGGNLRSVTVNLTAGQTLTLVRYCSPSGNLTVAGGIFDLSTETIDPRVQGGMLTVSNGATLKIGGTNGFPAKYIYGHSLAPSSTVEYAGSSQTVSAESYGNLTISGSGTKILATTTTVAGDLTVSAGTFDLQSWTANRSAVGGTLTVSNGAVLSVGNTNNFPANYTTVALGPTSTVNYDADSGAQTVSAQTYGHLTLSGSSAGAKTMPGTAMTTAGNFTLSGKATTTTAANLTVGGNLDVGTGTQLTVAGFAFMVTGTTSVAGTLTHSNATGTKQYTGRVTISTGGVWNNSGNAAITVRGGLMHSGATLTAGNGVYKFDVNDQAIGGTSAISIASVTVAGVTLTNSGTLTVGSALSGTGGLTNGATGTLNIGGTSDITTLTATVSGNTVNFSGATQTVKAVTYHHLTLSGSGTKTLTGVTTINGNLTLSGSATAAAAAGMKIGGGVTLGSGTTFDASSDTHIMSGDWTNNGGTFTANTSTITFNGIGAQGIGGTTSTTFNNLTVSNSSATISLATAQTVNGTLTIGSGATLGDDGFTLTAKGNVVNSGTHSGTGKLLLNGGAAAHNLSGSGSYGNLELDDANGATLGGSPTVNGTLTLTNGLLTLGDNNLTIGSDSAIAGGPFSGSKMIVADGAGSLCKSLGTISNYSYPIGDATTGADYSPVTGVTASGSASGNPSICFRVTNAAYPGMPGGPTTWITRYWTGSKTGTWTALSYGATFNFVAGDPNNSTNPMEGKKWDGATWVTLGPVSLVSNSFTGTGLTSLSDFTAYNSEPTAVTLASFEAAQATDTIMVTWVTLSELDNRGFNVWRGTSPAGPDIKLNDTMIPSQSPGLPVSDFTYTFEDSKDLVPGTTYYYWLEDLDTNDRLTLHPEPISVAYAAPTAVRLGSLSTGPASRMEVMIAEHPAGPFAAVTITAVLALMAVADTARSGVRRRR